MKNLRRILLATDLEPKSDRAMERAAQLARQSGAELTALHVVHDGDGPYAHLPLHHIEAELHRHLLAVPGAAGLTMRAVAVRGAAVEPQVAGYAGLWWPDLVVVGVHAHDGLADVFLPPTVERIAIADETPVLIVRDKPHGPYARALVPVDFSERSRAAVETARRLLSDGNLHLLHVADLPLASRSPTGRSTAGDITHEFAGEFGKMLRGMAPDGPAVTREVRIGHPVPEIVRAARYGHYDLVVMGSARRDGLMRAFLGSVTQDVLADLPCDALLAGDSVGDLQR
ncbi:Nucleotide-binding universal stress protein, UspA family [Azospirillum oryzae]|uniref:Nucleotide-binding universal stress protein, UspA family n=1 Tax=Azospirillum oryzae TaxID=286727 RepID=A0A1X7DSY7_9PROT|nr:MULTISPECIES: universal stress protein [Azospirillum]PWC56449.1 universal stress protein [Azospirillum sp. TSH7]PWC65322.1 universal stress protein [Azospirillum sp. TSH20]SMF21192.1 Nucleotide-binding universal stress protein, UspA family [Azospirillum oryzae]